MRGLLVCVMLAALVRVQWLAQAKRARSPSGSGAHDAHGPDHIKDAIGHLWATLRHGAVSVPTPTAVTTALLHSGSIAMSARSAEHVRAREAVRSGWARGDAVVQRSRVQHRGQGTDSRPGSRSTPAC